MKSFVNKKTTKKLIIILVSIISLICITPKITFAVTDTEDGGPILEAIEEFIVFLCDNVMQWLQDTFVTTDDIEEDDGVYNYQYSPAIIFSGTVPALDVNFISPNRKARNNKNYGNFVESKRIEIFMNAPECTYDTYKGKSNERFEFDYSQRIDDYGVQEDIWSNPTGGIPEEEAWVTKYKYYAKKINPSLVIDKEDPNYSRSAIEDFIRSSELYNPIQNEALYSNTSMNLWYYEKNNKLYVECVSQIQYRDEDSSGIMTTRYFYDICTYDLNDDIVLNEINDEAEYKSVTSDLQPTIATWYKALRRISLVGLLSVLLYVGIRIVLSASSSDKVRYKNMLKDWLVAICLLFTLHYIMNITLVSTNKISAIFQSGESDVLLNELRKDIWYGLGNGGSWGQVLAKVIMYVTLVVYTILFTIQYLKRVIYMAFYTLIAPLITLTYPLDKIKDGQAQAFSTWIREFIYTALVQVVHLVIYFVLVSTALDVVDNYPLYAIIVLTFMKKAEGIIKKMFGFDKAETVGTLGQAVTGGLIMNAINQIGKTAKSASSGGKGSKEQSNNTNVRTAQNNPLSAIQGDTSGFPGGIPGGGEASEGIVPTFSVKPKRSIGKGVTALGKRYSKTAVKGFAKGTLGILAGGTGAMLGFASGVAQGDLGKAVSGAFAGGTAGSALGNGVVDFASGIPSSVIGKVDNVKDIWNEGAYGKDFAESASAAREFKRTSDYRALRNKYGSDLTDEKIRTMLSSGITKKSDMEKILDSWVKM